jgi:predicted PurR-regulated permease PerM
MKSKSVLLFTLIFSTSIAFSQVTTKFKDTGSISDQIDNIIKNSNRYEDYKVVKINWLEQLKNNVNDSIVVYKNEITAANGTISSQKKSIDSLKIALNTSDTTITNLSNEIQSISLVGIEMNKSAFKTTMFSIIAILALLLAFFITKFKQSNNITLQAKQDLKELDEEFESHRKKALEREQKVRRQLQDELNKQKKD